MYVILSQFLLTAIVEELVSHNEQVSVESFCEHTVGMVLNG